MLLWIKKRRGPQGTGHLSPDLLPAFPAQGRGGTARAKVL